MLKEMRTLQCLRHSNLVSMLGARVRGRPRTRVRSSGAFFEEGRISLVLEYMDRGACNAVCAASSRVRTGSLQSAIDKHGPLGEELIRSIAFQMTNGLAYMHANRQLHRDIKPANVLLNRKVRVAAACGSDRDAVCGVRWGGACLPRRVWLDEGAPCPSSASACDGIVCTEECMKRGRRVR